MVVFRALDLKSQLLVLKDSGLDLRYWIGIFNDENFWFQGQGFLHCFYSFQIVDWLDLHLKVLDQMFTPWEFHHKG